MKYLKFKDIKLRKNFFKIEKKKLFLKIILKDNRFNHIINELAALKLAKFKSKFYKTKIKNRCIFTNRSRWIINKFRISRMKFKKMASIGLIQGIKKSSW
jgi:small subunit ribosomal protein S14